jgi:hypothetical protein
MLVLTQQNMQNWTMKMVIDAHQIHNQSALAALAEGQFVSSLETVHTAGVMILAVVQF